MPPRVPADIPAMYPQNPLLKFRPKRKNLHLLRRRRLQSIPDPPKYVRLHVVGPSAQGIDELEAWCCECNTYVAVHSLRGRNLEFSSRGPKKTKDASRWKLVFDGSRSCGKLDMSKSGKVWEASLHTRRYCSTQLTLRVRVSREQSRQLSRLQRIHSEKFRCGFVHVSTSQRSIKQLFLEITSLYGRKLYVI